MTSWRRKRVAVALAAAGALALAGLGVATQGGSNGGGDQAGPRYRGYLERIGAESEEGEHGIPESVGGPSSESGEIYTSITSVANARLAPYGSVAAGQLSASLGNFRSLTSNGSQWDEVTNTPYDADDPNYRDPDFSNSSGGAGFVAGRITGLAAGDGYLFAGGANGGVFRKALNDTADPNDDGPWQPISDAILSLSTGDLEFHDGALWYATGEANTGATSYVGSGVYRNPRATAADLGTAQFTDGDRVGGTELESRGINKLRFDDAHGWAYAATTRGLWRHPLSSTTGAWTNVFMPNLAADSDITKPYKNIVNDVAVDDAGGVLANAAWRSGDASYNGFYYSATGAEGTFNQVNPQGGLGYQQVGNTEFAWGTDAQGHKKVLYAVVESPNKLQHSPQTVLYGVYKSPSGTLAGPWNRIADSAKFQSSGSALQGGGGNGYRPGVQAWYNNFIETEPGHPDHVWVGLEEVYETTNGGSNWTTPGPYWNFGFKCWNITNPTCPETTHSDQHSIVVEGGRVYVGNDGGVKSRPVNGELDKYGHASDWFNHSQGLRTLQYYSVGVGKDPERTGYAVSGGLQDNGGSLLRGDGKDNGDPASSEMVSPFGGDGGDIIVNPKNGCQILDEYVFLTLWMTKNCGQSDGTTKASYDVSVPDSNPRFTAPFRAIRGSENTRDGESERWIAGGNSVWTHDLAFSTKPEEISSLANHGWTKRASLAKGSEMIVGLDAVADPTAKQDATKDTIVAAWCGESNCNSAGFSRGVKTNFGGTWHELDMTGLPNRFPNAVWIDDTTMGDTATVYLVFNGYNRRFIEGPGSGEDHVWKGVMAKDGGVTWTNESAGFPDVPATDVLRYGDNLVVGTDYGVMVGALNAAGDVTSWKRVGGQSGNTGALPLTTVFDLSVGPDGNLYAATHGRGIWKTSLADLS